MFQTMKRDIHA